MNDSICDTIKRYLDKLCQDKHHSSRSWEHCYAHFRSCAAENDTLSHLQLAFYLASWGMYRGSGFLLKKDYLVHEPVVSMLLKPEHKDLQKLDFSSEDDNSLKEIICLSKSIKKCYTVKMGIVNNRGERVNVSDTLVTKIMLGTLGCIPAYDQYFKKGIRKKSISYSKLNIENLKEVVKFYRSNKKEFDRVNKYIKKKRETDYPPMKLVDMYFWQLGKEAMDA